MAAMRRTAALSLLLVLWVSSSLDLAALSQPSTNRLPPARWQTNATGGGGQTYSVGQGQMMMGGLKSTGMHLTRGESRTAANAADPYNPGEPALNMALVRWQRAKMPLRIWISPGLKLPEMDIATITNQRVEQVFQMVQSGYPFEQLPVAKGWTQETNYQVAAGIEQWRQFQDEGLLSYGFTSNPYDAHIMVFFTEQFAGAAGPGGVNVGGNTVAQVFTLAQTQLPQYKQKPVIIELNTTINYTPEKMQASAAHEFGHALGIKEHSPYREDIMYVDRIVDQLSEGDKATLRMLYRSNAQYVM